MGIMGSGKARCEVPERFKTQQAWGTWGMAPASLIFPGEGGLQARHRAGHWPLCVSGAPLQPQQAVNSIPELSG